MPTTNVNASVTEREELASHASDAENDGAERDAHAGSPPIAAAGSVHRNGTSKRDASVAVVYMPAPKNAPCPKEK